MKTSGGSVPVKAWNVRKKRRRISERQRDWTALPVEILFLIFRNLRAFDILAAAQYVCLEWRRLALDPRLWRRIDFRYPFCCHADNDQDFLSALAMAAVIRSQGGAEELIANSLGYHVILDFAAKWVPGLRCIALTSAWGDRPDRFLTRLTALEELRLINCVITAPELGAVGRTRPELKHFSFNKTYSKHYLPLAASLAASDNNYEALEVAGSMSNLRELQLVGNKMTNEGLSAILDSCLLLESLDIRGCFHLTLDSSVRARLAGIRNVKLPRYSSAEYEFENGLHSDDPIFTSALENLNLKKALKTRLTRKTSPAVLQLSPKLLLPLWELRRRWHFSEDIGDLDFLFDDR